jgi:hypothetical protein
MKQPGSTNAPQRPTIVGQYALFTSPHSPATWLLDASELDRQGRLQWVACNDEALLQAALCGYHAFPPGGVSDPYVRTSVIRQYAANMMIRAEQSSPMDQAQRAEKQREIAQLFLVKQQGPRLIPFAISEHLEADTPYLAHIEQMLSIVSLRKHRDADLRLSTLTLQSLRDGLDPSGGMFTTLEQLQALCQQHPALRAVEVPSTHDLESRLDNTPTP